MSQFFDYDGITFNRSKIQVVSGFSIDANAPEREPFFRVILENGVEWQFSAPTYEELMTLRAAFITALNS